jgi:hypothetical protein
MATRSYTCEGRRKLLVAAVDGSLGNDGAVIAGARPEAVGMDGEIRDFDRFGNTKRGAEENRVMRASACASEWGGINDGASVWQTSGSKL